MVVAVVWGWLLLVSQQELPLQLDDLGDRCQAGIWDDKPDTSGLSSSSCLVFVWDFLRGLQKT